MTEEREEAILRRRTVLAGTALAATAGLSGCLGGIPGIEGGERVSATVTDTFDATRVHAAAVGTTAGDVTVVGEDRDTIDVRAEKRADSQEALESVTVRTEVSDDRLAVSVERDESSGFDGTSATVSLELTVPTDLRLARVETVSGPVDLSDVAGPLSVESSSSDLLISSVDGDVEAESTSGRIDVEEVDGDVGASTTSGDVEISTVSGGARIATVSGEVSVSDVQGTVDR